MLIYFGIASALLDFLSVIPYIRDTLKGKTKPHRVTWGLFLLVNLIFVGNQLAAGVNNSLWLIGSYTAYALIVFLLSLKFGTGGRSRLDVVVLIIALAGAAFWLIFNSPLISVLANLFVASLAYIPTFKKAYTHPQTETKITWLMATAAALLSIISIGQPNLTMLLLPCYAFVVQGSLFTLLVLRTKRISRRGQSRIT